ncbi:DUF1963 domain-containing protein [Nodularia sp. NIES-3585]|uniref:DUF1963 domain-containing protein n=1 Tax=Nodularia sp. NIES-3585 TaxID=1973477 RepID=UPI000B684737|nr:DUF1963 domain-containing protein [Nodularia sp. NIES-3585]GAX34715.1 hypothetical protein NIES3585_07170 [Nodularia sp. NIES-3585]
MEVIYLELSDGQSHKFYEVTINNAEATIRYGRIGTQGQTSSQTYDTPEKAQTEATKKINEKLKKGYVQATLIENPQFLRDLPRKFSPLKKFIEENLKPYIKITAGEQVGEMNTLSYVNANGDPLTLWQSKIGGNPYFPKDMAYPIDRIDGLAMPLLIQINCADVPQIAGFDFPQQGILQFYLGFEPADASSNPDKYRVLYFPEISEDENDLITDFSFIDNDYTIRDFYGEVYPLSFSVSHDFFWESRYGENIEIPEEFPELSQAFNEWIYDYNYEHHTGMRGDKLGGYVNFCSEVNHLKEEIKGRLLLEFYHPFNSDHSFYFFIENAQLKNRDFSEIEFYFDCM